MANKNDWNPLMNRKRNASKGTTDTVPPYDDNFNDFESKRNTYDK